MSNISKIYEQKQQDQLYLLKSVQEKNKKVQDQKIFLLQELNKQKDLLESFFKNNELLQNSHQKKEQNNKLEIQKLQEQIQEENLIYNQLKYSNEEGVENLKNENKLLKQQILELENQESEQLLDKNIDSIQYENEQLKQLIQQNKLRYEEDNKQNSVNYEELIDQYKKEQQDLEQTLLSLQNELNELKLEGDNLAQILQIKD